MVGRGGERRGRGEALSRLYHAKRGFVVRNLVVQTKKKHVRKSMRGFEIKADERPSAGNTLCLLCSRPAAAFYYYYERLE